MKSISLTFIAILFFTLSCNSNTTTKETHQKEKMSQQDLAKYETAYFASGCFWCVEAVFESVKGVKEVVSGYAGGKAETANYNLVSAGRTDHAEAVKVYYDAKVVSYETLVKVFFGSHDPTTLNRQGPDAGRQYRSAIFYKDANEKKIVDAYIAKLKADKVFSGAITTEITKYTAFYDAEAYHQDYEANNPNNPYIRGVSVPRLKRFQKKFPELLKKDAH
ncbi:peptide-methionine (S)-S-oxide reductase MsrA [Kordia sp. YSTF-M3]|uniref:Peptide methionine sulfoxide reductase MsrA n=1 Tax=Kordia aestuariivivens TaxID=2759037 RepID=A0ABR7QCN0_9FLAO|nr:peptide-methionine (S)-S-oxide reductase MsrA [Kordia aestuariivivens]MBC8756332.1 peptide-methionine (S)-S-oxide reductase MsrA [Kordia aestuariivivens]